MSYLSENDKYRIINDPDFIFSKKFLYSFASAMEKYPDGAPVKFICRVLNLTPQAYDKILKSSLNKIKNKM
ncbi:hypothetical protein EBU95_03810 [bacterium]|nr:hypothetical protein [bacterium]